jgi:cytidine deaminase
MNVQSFWLRKTRKPVLCVLMVQNTANTQSSVPLMHHPHPYSTPAPLPETLDQSFVFLRGINMEVSMPTGSLCAERCAISSALSSNLCLSRSDLIMLGVLSVVIHENEEQLNHSSVDVALNPLSPCGACMEWLRKIAETNPDFRIVTYTNTSCKQVFINSVQ